MRSGALGDTLMLVPALHRLHETTDVIFVGRYPGIDYIRPLCDLCIDYESGGWHRLFMDTMSPDTPPMVPSVDVVVAFVSSVNAVVRKNLARWFSDTPLYIFRPLPSEGGTTHTALHAAEALEKAGLPLDAAGCIKAARVRPLLNIPRSTGHSGCVILHPGSGSITKNYPPDFWMLVVEALKREIFGGDERVVILLGPAEEHLLTFFGNHQSKIGIDIVWSPPVEKLLHMLSICRLYIGHDSGVTHLSAMAGLPVVALFKGSSIHQWRPLGPRVTVIEEGKNQPDLIEHIVVETEKHLSVSRDTLIKK